MADGMWGSIDYREKSTWAATRIWLILDAQMQM